MRVRRTKQERLLSIALAEMDSFFTAHDLFKKARINDKSLGIATVYRFLKEHKDKLHSYICNRRILYSRNKDNHCHFKCSRCGKLIHIRLKSVDFLKNSIKGSICHFQIDLQGICEQCAE